MTPTQKKELAERAAKREPEKYKKADNDDQRTTVWLDDTPENRAWLENEVEISLRPGHGRRIIIPQRIRGILTGKIALQRYDGKNVFGEKS